MLLHGGIVIGINLSRPLSFHPRPQNTLPNELSSKSAGSKANRYKDKSNMIYV